MAKRMNRGRSSESSARSRRSRGRQVRYCAVAALPGMRFRAWPGTDAPFPVPGTRRWRWWPSAGGPAATREPRSRRPRTCSRLHPSSPRCLSPGGPARPHRRAVPALPRPPHPSWWGTPPSARPRISARSRTGGSPGPLGRATRKHHQARTPGQHDQSV